MDWPDLYWVLQTVNKRFVHHFGLTASLQMMKKRYSLQMMVFVSSSELRCSTNISNISLDFDAKIRVRTVKVTLLTVTGRTILLMWKIVSCLW